MKTKNITTLPTKKINELVAFAAWFHSHSAAARLLCGSVYLGTHSGSSPRHGALQLHCLGSVDSQSGTECEPSTHVINFGHANQLGAFTGTADFVTHPCDPDPDLCENNIPYTGTFDWFAANGDEISGTFEGYPVPNTRRKCTTIMKPRR